MFGISELAIILIVVILVLGAKRLPELARSAGKSARILKAEAKAMKEPKGGGAEAGRLVSSAAKRSPGPTADARGRMRGSRPGTAPETPGLAGARAVRGHMPSGRTPRPGVRTVRECTPARSTGCSRTGGAG